MPTYLLDTDTLSLLRKAHPEVGRGVLRTPFADRFAPVIAVEEQLTGWYTEVRKARRPADLAAAYANLASTVGFYTRLQIAPFDLPAIAEFDRLRRLKLNVGSNDLRIAAIARTIRAAVVTRNRRDFDRVPGLRVEDWSVPLAGPPPAA